MNIINNKTKKTFAKHFNSFVEKVKIDINDSPDNSVELDYKEDIDNKSTKSIFIDIDDTICYYDNSNDKLDYNKAKPNYNKIKIVNELYENNHITMWTARGAITGIDWYQVTKQQLDKWGVKYHNLRLDKPAYDLFIDDKALNCLEQVKLMKKIFDK